MSFAHSYARSHIIIIIIIIISFMQGIYTYIPETNYFPRQYSVATILLLLFYYYYYYYYYYCGLDSSVGIATELRAGRSGIESRWGRDFPPVQTDPGAHPASCKMGTGPFPG